MQQVLEAVSDSEGESPEPMSKGDFMKQVLEAVSDSEGEGGPKRSASSTTQKRYNGAAQGRAQQRTQQQQDASGSAQDAAELLAAIFTPAPAPAEPAAAPAPPAAAAAAAAAPAQGASRGKKPGYGSMTKIALHALCKERGIKGYSKLRKQELVRLLLASEPGEA